MIMRQPQRASSICQKIAKSLSNRDKARGQKTYLQNEGWRFIDKAKEIFSLRSLVRECEFTVLNIRTGSRWDISNKIITTALLLAILHSHPPESWNYQFGRYFIPWYYSIKNTKAYFSSKSRITECSKSAQAQNGCSGRLFW